MTATTTERSPSILDGLIEAAQAIHDLPKVKEELDFAKLEAEDLRHSLDNARTEAQAMMERIAELEATVASKEAALSDATFRNEALQGAIDVIRGALPSQRPVASPVPEPSVDVTPEAKVEAEAPLDSAATSTTPSDAPTHSAASPNDASSATAEVQPQSPFATTVPDTPTASSGMTEGHGTEATSTPPQASDANMAHGPATEDREPMGEASPASVSGSSLHTAQGATAPSSVSATSQPSQPAAKPSHMTWREWQANGNVVPVWVHDLNAA